MTACVTEPENDQRAAPAVVPWERIGFGLLLVATAVLYLWDLPVNGWANGFYSAAAQAGSSNGTAFLFGSSDAANAITVDKIPASLWVTDVSVWLFGLNPWSVLVPQALAGVAAVALLYASVRRVAGAPGALLAGGAFALTPVAALMFRYNNPDALLTLLLVAGAYCVIRACERGARRWWPPLAGLAVGVAFLAKMLQALLVLPGFALAYLVAGHGPFRTRATQAAAAGAVLVASGGWYLVLAELWPVTGRPYIGGSQHNSIVELALGYNGVGRLTGDEVGGLGNPNFDAGWTRLLGSGMGTEIGWLVPAAVICLAAGVWITRRRPRTDPTRASLMLWGGWLLVTGTVLSFADGIVHSYYTVALAPAVGGLIGIGAVLLWRRRADIRAAVALAGIVLVTTLVACVLMGRDASWLPWLRAAIAVAGVGSALVFLIAGRLGEVATRAVGALAMGACLAAPAAYSIATVTTPHTGVLPTSGPSRSVGPSDLFGMPQPGASLTAALQRDAARYRWTAGVVGSSNAAGYQLASETPVMAIGGFNGTDPFPTLGQFQHFVAERQIHYFIAADHVGLQSPAQDLPAADIAAWVAATYPAESIDGVVVFDLTAPAKRS